MSASHREKSPVSGVTVLCQELSMADHGDVVDIEKQSFSQPWSADELRTAIGDPSAICIGSWLDGEPIGFAIGYLEDTAFHLATLAVLPSQRGRGYGGSLLRQVLHRACQRGCIRCTLEVRRLNTGARCLYMSNGFSVDDICWNYYPNPRDHAVLMSRRL